jgi:nicotinamide-nucleotide amidase
MSVHDKKETRLLLSRACARESLKKIFFYFKKTGWSLACAESCTAGLFTAAVTGRSGASAFFRGGVVAYSNDVKRDVLQVNQDVLDTHGAVSRECAAAMATGACALFRADACVAVSGIAGPSGGTPDKPVGTVCIAVQIRGESSAEQFRFSGTRKRIRLYAVRMALKMLEDRLRSAVQCGEG